VGSTPRLETDVDPQDRYGRVLAYAYAADGRMVNEEMALRGYALSLTYPPNVRYVERMRSAVQEARSEGRGLHATSAFACTPKDYRAGNCR
jgi:micrococcal nuclease